MILLHGTGNCTHETVWLPKQYLCNDSMHGGSHKVLPLDWDKLIAGTVDKNHGSYPLVKKKEGGTQRKTTAGS